MFMLMVQDDRKKRLDQQIDENLRKVFKSTLEEEVPERFLDLLRKLKDQGTPE
ncbi:MAG: NepR family anti-sigma factor [Pseudomonadota bacterium]